MPNHSLSFGCNLLSRPMATWVPWQFSRSVASCRWWRWPCWPRWLCWLVTGEGSSYLDQTRTCPLPLMKITLSVYLIRSLDNLFSSCNNEKTWHFRVIFRKWQRNQRRNQRLRISCWRAFPQGLGQGGDIVQRPLQPTRHAWTFGPPCVFPCFPDFEEDKSGYLR